MGRIVFIRPDATRVEVEIKPGNTVMETAIAHEVPGIEAQCYGAGICGTCHVYARQAGPGLLAPPSDWERDMLACLDLAEQTSRLSCQLRFTADMEGMEFTIPKWQDALS